MGFFAEKEIAICIEEAHGLRSDDLCGVREGQLMRLNTV
jgi:hypothetical protein